VGRKQIKIFQCDSCISGKGKTCAIGVVGFPYNMNCSLYRYDEGNPHNKTKNLPVKVVKKQIEETLVSKSDRSKALFYSYLP
jgi:hypothetical protein